MEIISRTTIGSTMWKMNNSKSDVDHFEIYLGSTKNLLKGIPNNKSTWSISDKVDINRHELGKVVDQLIKGNVNFIWGVTSPIVNRSTLEFRELRNLTFNNISKSTYHSIRGLAKSNYKKYLEGIENPSRKKCNIIVRSLDFGINLLKYGKLVYKPVRKGTPERILKKLDELDKAYEKSTLPEKPDENAYREFLFRVRTNYLYNIEGITEEK